MSSSSSALRRRPSRVLRDTDPPAQPSTAPDVFDLDLAPSGLARLDPARVDAAVEEGRAAGYDDGYAAGHQAGLEAARAVQADLTAAYQARLQSVIQASEAAVADALSGVEAVADAAARVTAGAAFTLAEAIVGRELVLATDPGRDAVARALAIAPDNVDLKLRLNPDDAATFDATSVPSGRVVTIVPDPSVGIGDCLAEAGWTRVDARIETALERVRAVLEGSA